MHVGVTDALAVVLVQEAAAGIARLSVLAAHINAAITAATARPASVRT